jgi:hypothetical protein
MVSARDAFPFGLGGSGDTPPFAVRRFDHRVSCISLGLEWQSHWRLQLMQLIAIG